MKHGINKKYIAIGTDRQKNDFRNGKKKHERPVLTTKITSMVSSKTEKLTEHLSKWKNI